jgi:hypothetical protein
VTALVFYLMLLKSAVVFGALILNDDGVENESVIAAADGVTNENCTDRTNARRG